jgi:hypothetical protein
MSAKKKQGADALASRGDPQAFTVVLEDLRSRFEVFGEALQGMREQMDARFVQVDARFEQIDARFERNDLEIGLVKTVLVEHGRQLRSVRDAVDRIEAKLDEKTDRGEVNQIVRRAISKHRSGS